MHYTYVSSATNMEFIIQEGYLVAVPSQGPFSVCNLWVGCSQSLQELVIIMCDLVLCKISFVLESDFTEAK
jgi:hypothetical protein